MTITISSEEIFLFIYFSWVSGDSIKRHVQSLSILGYFVNLLDSGHRLSFCRTDWKSPANQEQANQFKCYNKEVFSELFLIWVLGRFQFDTEVWIICRHGRRKERAGGPRPPWILKILAKKGCFLSFEWEKTNFTTFASPWKNFGKIPWCPPLEKFLPTPMSAGTRPCNLKEFEWELRTAPLQCELLQTTARWLSCLSSHAASINIIRAAGVTVGVGRIFSRGSH